MHMTVMQAQQGKWNPGLAHDLYHLPQQACLGDQSKLHMLVMQTHGWYSLHKCDRANKATVVRPAAQAVACHTILLSEREVSWHACQQAAADNRLILAQSLHVVFIWPGNSPLKFNRGYMQCKLSYLALPSSFLAAFSAASLPSAAGAD